MPYMSKSDLHRVIEDLPEATELGRTGEVIEDPIVARVCRQECTSTSIREQLKHLDPDVGKNKLNKIRSKYRNLPDNYYGGDSAKYLTPENYPDVQACRDKYVCQKHDPDNYYPGSSVKMWEWYSGSAALSAYLT